MKYTAVIDSYREIKNHLELDSNYAPGSLEKVVEQLKNRNITVYKDYDVNKPIGKVISTKMEDNKLIAIIDIEKPYNHIEKEFCGLGFKCNIIKDTDGSNKILLCDLEVVTAGVFFNHVNPDATILKPTDS